MPARVGEEAVTGPARVAKAAALGSIALGAVVLTGWWLDLGVLKSILPGRPRMPANIALVFVLLGLALSWVLPEPNLAKSPPRYRAGQVLALVAAFLGLATLIEHTTGWNPGLDELLFPDPNAATHWAIPGRPSFPCALTTLLLGLGIALLDKRIGRLWVGQFLTVTGVLIPFLAVIGHACNVSEFYGSVSKTTRGTGMAIHGSAGFLVLSAGMLAARSKRGLMAVLWSHTPGGTLARWLMLAPAAGLLLTGVVYLALVEGTRVDREVRVWMLGVSNLILLTLPIWAMAQALHQAGLERDEVQETLEDRVLQRTSELTHTNEALRESEERLKELVSEKEALLQEIHHRVKNNLQIISSLLRLQALEIREPKLLAVFEESRSRIHAMALIHERLYRVDSLGTPDYAAYLNDLVVAVGRAFRPRDLQVTFDVQVSAVGLGVDAAVPVGLIVNELVSNSLKHGHPKVQPSRIVVRLEGSPESHYALSVRDHGVGLPPGFAIEDTKSMGLRLVTLLARQLQGRIEIHHNEGTEFCIRFQTTRRAAGEADPPERASDSKNEAIHRPQTHEEGQGPDHGR